MQNFSSTQIQWGFYFKHRILMSHNWRTNTSASSPPNAHAHIYVLSLHELNIKLEFFSPKFTTAAKASREILDERIFIIINLFHVNGDEQSGSESTFFSFLSREGNFFSDAFQTNCSGTSKTFLFLFRGGAKMQHRE